MKKSGRNDKRVRTILVILCAVLVPAFLTVSEKVLNSGTVSILNFGDVMFDRGIRNIMDLGRDPFEHIKKEQYLLSGYDMVIANLEGPIVEMERSACQQKIYNFQFAKDTPDRLKSIGINMVNIANNHSYDCWEAGFLLTKKYLEEAGILYMGDRELGKSFIVKNINGMKAAFIGIDGVTAPIPVSSFYPLIKKLNDENDLVVVNIHWGEEYLLKETSVQREIGHKLIDNGADVIFGHHPHVVEPVEIYKGKAIFYSLGNFVFDQDFGDTTTGLGAGMVFRESKTTFTLFPYKLKKFTPDLFNGEEKEKFCKDYLKNIAHVNCNFDLKL